MEIVIGQEDGLNFKIFKKININEFERRKSKTTYKFFG